jgi:hypothetical protein
MMKKLIVLIALFGLAGCATTGTQQSQVERISPEELAKIMPPAVATLTLDEVVAMSKAGKSSDEIIDKIKATNSRYELSSTQIVDLSKRGVDNKVLDFIQQSNEQAKQNAMADEINKREQAKRKAQEQLARERAFRDPFFYGPPYFYPYGYWRGPRFGLRYGYPYW